MEGAVLAATEEYALREGAGGQLLPNAQSLTNVFGLVLVAYVNVRVCMYVCVERGFGWGFDAAASKAFSHLTPASFQPHSTQAEVVHKAAAMAWVERHEAGSGGNERAQALFRTPRTQKFVAWIRAYESESEEESSDEEDDSSVEIDEED